MSVDSWSVLVELDGPEVSSELDPERLARLFDYLYEHQGAHLAGGENKISVRMTVPNGPTVTTPEDAAMKGKQIVLDALRTAGLEDWTLASLTAEAADLETTTESRRRSAR